MSQKQFQRIAAAFNAMCRSAEIDDCPFSPLQKQLIFDQPVFACSDLSDTFQYGKFEDACTALA